MKQFLIVIYILVSFDSMGQVSLGTNLYVGKSEKSNNSEPIRTSTIETKYRNSFVAGIFSEYKFNNWFSIQLDLLYDQLRTEQLYFTNKNDPNSYRTIESNKIEYFSLPLTLQFQHKRLHFNIGYQTSFLISNYYEFTEIDQRGNTSIFKGIENDMLLRRNISVVLGLSYDIYKNISIEGRYVKGLTNIMNANAWYVYDATTTQFLIGLSYKITFKKKEKQEVEQQEEQK